MSDFTPDELERQKEEQIKDAKRCFFVASSEADAFNRYKKYRNKDPFPDILPALLNSEDIFRYVEKTGMLCPFHVEDLAGASYEVRIKGEIIWWDAKKKKQHTEKLEKPGDFFKLEPNSIAFVTLEPYFQVPDYLALRFNLKINHVYKGLLLGTGPLVDPGFCGRLSIPLHNLTANIYTFQYNDAIIEMEFTKLSPNSEWGNQKLELVVDENKYFYKRNWIKPGRGLSTYIQRALQGSNDSVVKSSIPTEIDKIKKFSGKIKKQVGKKQRQQEKKLNRLQLVTFLTLVPVLAFACTAIYQLGSNNTVKRDLITALETKMDTQLKKNEELSGEIQEQKKKNEELQKEICKLQRKIDHMENKN